MKRRWGRFLYGILALCVLLGEVRVFAADDIDMDAFLLAKGVPEEVLAVMHEAQKERVIETLEDGMVFASYEKTEHYLEALEDGVMPAYANIPSSDLTLSVVTFVMTANGTEIYAIYPSFVWNKSTKVANDTFAMRLYDGWEVVPDAPTNLEVWKGQGGNGNVEHSSVAPSDATYNGYAFTVPNSVGGGSYYYEGHAYLKAIKKNPSATEMITLNYADDTTPNATLGYSVSIGTKIHDVPIGFTVSVSANKDYLRTLGGNYSLNIYQDDGEDDE